MPTYFAMVAVEIPQAALPMSGFKSITT